MEWTAEKVAALAPNASTERRGKTLAQPSKWTKLGTNGAAIWGECRGTGSLPYLPQIDLTGPAFKCTCPARKVPCKHVLGLFFLYVDKHDFGTDNPPEWVSVWLSKRQPNKIEEAPKKTIEELEKAKNAKAKRWEKRLLLMASGIDELELWLKDLVRQGLANVSASDPVFWSSIAAKMMDAQLPRVSTILKEAGALVEEHPNWIEIVSSKMGELYLVVEAFKHREQLSESMQDELFNMLGRLTKKADVLEHQPKHLDKWLVIGQKEGIDIEGRTYRRTWLHGTTSHKNALVLDYAFGNTGFQQQYVVGTLLKGKLAYYPSNFGQRAVLGDFQVEALSPDLQLKSFLSVEDLLEHYAQCLNVSPWLSQFPALIENVIPYIQKDEHYLLVDQEQRVLPLKSVRAQAIYKMLAISGGQPITVFGEWLGQEFEPLSILVDHKMMLLS
ncbi:MAG: hypothetical protein GY810_25580 [Aureispira sp.]|nr:hypothetical protein [Aureispira sp.]